MSNVATEIFGQNVNSFPAQPNRTVHTGHVGANVTNIGNGATVTIRSMYTMGYQFFGSAYNQNDLKESHFMAPDWMVVSFRPTSAYNVIGQIQLNATGWTTIQTTGCAAGVPVFTWFTDLWADNVRFQVEDTGAVGENVTILIMNAWRPR